MAYNHKEQMLKASQDMLTRRINWCAAQNETYENNRKSIDNIAEIWGVSKDNAVDFLNKAIKTNEACKARAEKELKLVEAELSKHKNYRKPRYRKLDYAAATL